MGVVASLVLIAVALVLAWLVSVVEPSLDAKVGGEAEISEPIDCDCFIVFALPHLQVHPT